jgi:hypothetical protein
MLPACCELVAVARPAGDRSTQLFSNIIPWLILLVGVILAGGVLIFFLRSYLRSDGAGGNQGFTLQDLREMRAAGELTEAEYERAKSMMIGRLRETPAAPLEETDPDTPAAPPGNTRSS